VNYTLVDAIAEINYFLREDDNVCRSDTVVCWRVATTLSMLLAPVALYVEACRAKGMITCKASRTTRYVAFLLILKIIAFVHRYLDV